MKQVLPSDTVTRSEHLALSLPVLQENGTEEESKLLCQWRNVWKQDHPCHALETSWERKLKYPGKSLTPVSEGGHVSRRRLNMGATRGTCNPRILGERSVCFVDLGGLGSLSLVGSRLAWPAGRSQSSSSESLMVPASRQTLGHLQPGKELLVPWTWTFFCFLYSCSGFKVPFEIIVENNYMCSAVSVFCLAILISILKHADIKGREFFI